MGGPMGQAGGPDRWATGGPIGGPEVGQAGGPGRCARQVGQRWANSRWILGCSSCSGCSGFYTKLFHGAKSDMWQF
jgi:hypothetical protein